MGTNDITFIEKIDSKFDDTKHRAQPTERAATCLAGINFIMKTEDLPPTANDIQAKLASVRLQVDTTYADSR
jgi:hypothetical protein